MSDPAEVAALALLAAELDAQVITPAPSRHCPLCGSWVHPYRDGRLSWCLPCSVATLPGSFFLNSIRIEFVISWATLLRRVEDLGVPAVNPKAWLTPRKRLRSLGRPRSE